MQTQSIDIKQLNADPANVRKHDRRNLDAIKSSLARFGQQKPIVVGKGDVVIAGNGTLAAARELGWKSITIVRTELAGPEAVAFAIADNRTAELAIWDDQALAQTLAALQNDDDIDHLSTGFTDDEIDAFISNAVGITTSDDEHLPDEVNVPQVFQLIVTCEDEPRQQHAFDLLTAEGYQCRLCTL